MLLGSVPHEEGIGGLTAHIVGFLGHLGGLSGFAKLKCFWIVA